MYRRQYGSGFGSLLKSSFDAAAPTIKGAIRDIGKLALMHDKEIVKNGQHYLKPVAEKMVNRGINGITEKVVKIDKPEMRELTEAVQDMHIEKPEEDGGNVSLSALIAGKKKTRAKKTTTKGGAIYFSGEGGGTGTVKA